MSDVIHIISTPLKKILLSKKRHPTNAPVHLSNSS